MKTNYKAAAKHTFKTISRTYMQIIGSMSGF